LFNADPCGQIVEVAGEAHIRHQKRNAVQEKISDVYGRDLQLPLMGFELQLSGLQSGRLDAVRLRQRAANLMVFGSLIQEIPI